MAKKKSSGIDDLVNALVKQHGVSEALNRVRNQFHNSSNKDMWRSVYNKLYNIRELERGY